MGGIGSDLLERSERRTRIYNRRWFAPLAAVLALVLLLHATFDPRNLITRAYALAEPDYPTPKTGQYGGTWQYAADAAPFFETTYQQLLSGGENRICSPLNLYMSLALLAECSGGATRQQILDLLGADSQEDLRKQARRLWEDTYSDTCALSNSIWMDSGVDYVPDTVQTLAGEYYAASYHGDMGSAAYDLALSTWLDQHTDGRLGRQVRGAGFGSDTVLALVSAVRYEAQWKDQFSRFDTASGTFHSPDGDRSCRFMHSSDRADYYWGSHFAAAGKAMRNTGGTVLMILPDEGVDVRDLLTDPEVLDLIRQPDEFRDKRNVTLELTMPKFDISAETDLRESLTALGITDAFAPGTADFSPAVETRGACLSSATQGVCFSVDEEGAYGSAYVELAFGCAAEAPPFDGPAELTLDRPFLFVVLTDGGLPLLAGVVDRP